MPSPPIRPTRTSSSPATRGTTPTWRATSLPWLRRVRAAGLDVVVGDPGRRHLPREALVELAGYPVRTTSDLEDLGFRRAGVYRLAD